MYTLTALLCGAAAMRCPGVTPPRRRRGPR